jgi:taurine--2-oxoglutarate transaminase
METLADIAGTHRRHVLTPWAAQAALAPPVIVRGEGSWLIGDDGTRYLDGSSGLIAVNLGHAHPKLVQAIADQAGTIAYVSAALFNDRRAECGARLAGLGPWGAEGARVYFTTGGAEANEDAIKIARTVTGRHKVLSAYRSFHGSSFGAMTLTGENRRWANEPGIPGVSRFFAPYPYRSPFHPLDPADETRRALSHLSDVILAEDPERVAALLIEPVVGSNGVIVYPPGYLQGVRELCDRHGIVLIFDEVMTGFGRIGATFGGERFGVVPDLITFAKGVTSAYVPLGGVIVRERIAAYFDTNQMWLGHTYSGHPLAMAAALAAIEAYSEGDLFTSAARREARLRDRLLALHAKHEILGDVRGLGFFFALEFVKDRASRTPLVAWQGKSLGPMPAFFAGLRQRGAICFGRYNIVHLAPPLNTSDDDLDTFVAALDGAIGDLTAAAAARG